MKWVEAIPLKKVTHDKIIDFIEEHIIHRFEIPQTLTINQGTMFFGRRMINYANSRNIKMLASTPYYAQANGQVEGANKIIIALIKKYIDWQHRNWHNTLSQVLWAYRDFLRGSIGTTPYKLAYGYDVVLPIEINLQSIWVAR